ncbi:MAG TPA: CAP domain-containing protein [Solirubrobacteraceae bacterium]|jgi:uncharacterized protein YkwD
MLAVLFAPPPLDPASALAASARTTAKSPRSCAYANLRPTATDTALVDAATLCLIDQVRNAYRLRTLRYNRELQAVAGEQAKGMVRDDYFSDDSPSGQTPAALIAETSYGEHAPSLATGENLAWGTRSEAAPADIVASWMRSPPHRELILAGSFRDVGVGVSPAIPSIVGHGATGATYAVEFAAR